MLGLENEYVIGEAIFNIPKETAMGFASLAIQDYWGAANHFMSATTWGVAAGKGVANIVVSLSGSKSGGGYGGESVAGTSAGGGSGAIGTGAAAGPQAERGPVIILNVQGVISPDNLDDVIYQINDRVNGSGVVLHATTSQQLIRRA